MADANELRAPGKLDQILTAAGNTASELGIDPDSHAPLNIWQILPPYELETLPRQPIYERYGMSVMQDTPGGVARIASTYLIALGAKRNDHRYGEMGRAC